MFSYSVYWFIGAWSNGMIGVSKTFGEGSIPSAPANYEDFFHKGLSLFLLYKKMRTKNVLRLLVKDIYIFNKLAKIKHIAALNTIFIISTPSLGVILPYLPTFFG